MTTSADSGPLLSTFPARSAQHRPPVRYRLCNDNWHRNA
jgi:hypothetical protein